MWSLLSIRLETGSGGLCQAEFGFALFRYRVIVLIYYTISLFFAMANLSKISRAFFVLLCLG